jgi:hypothetical protein
MSVSSMYLGSLQIGAGMPDWWALTGGLGRGQGYPVLKNDAINTPHPILEAAAFQAWMPRDVNIRW